MPDPQQYPLNLYLFNNVEDIVVFLALTVIEISNDSLIVFEARNSQVTLIENHLLKINHVLKRNHEYLLYS